MLLGAAIAAALLCSSSASIRQEPSEGGSREVSRERAASDLPDRARTLALQVLARVLPPVQPSPQARPPIVPFSPPPRKISNATVALGLPAGAQFGHAVAAIGDLDADGVPDLAVGAPGDGMGAVRILFLNSDRTVKAHTRIGAPSSTWGESYGHAVCALGDLNGDGAVDFAASDPWGCGVFVHLLRRNGTLLYTVPITNSIEPPTFCGALETYGEGLASPGDVDGDGVPDLVVACGIGGDGDIARMYVVFLNEDGTVKGRTRTNTGNDWNLTCGALTDLDGDGIREFALGDQAYVRTYFLNPDGTVRSQAAIPGSSTPVTGVHDLDLDGVSDWALGIPGHAGSRGAYSLARLDTAGNLIPGSRILVPGPQSNSTLLHEWDRFGASLAFLGNLDPIGEPEIAVGAPGVSDGGVATGAVWIGAIR